MAKEILAKVACTMLKWGCEVDRTTLEVLKSYVADNMDQFSPEDLEKTNLLGKFQRHKEKDGEGTGSDAEAGVGAGAGAGAGVGANTGTGAGANDGTNPNPNTGTGVGMNSSAGAGTNSGAGDGANGGAGNGTGNGKNGGNGANTGAGEGNGADDETEELSEQIESMNMSGYESVEVREFGISVEGKLTANDLAKALHGYFYRPLHKSVTEEKALVGLIVGYRNINMEQLDRAFTDMKSAYMHRPSSVKREFIVINNLELEKERIQESEKKLPYLAISTQYFPNTKPKMHGVEGIFLTMAALRLAIDWKSIREMQEGRKWKKARYNELFEFQCRGQLEELPVLT
ncbi:hypothetical protein BDN71DRAFT_1432812 [Pleurotus eryngii]|uniref:Uncharacterized protein n=1 Tax=Pleurotus eryngii TaxID=5323 RepID=A0A9P5ZS64_PLEER|nr:hypothetical protein BDN71DRAFT_1432812 [Pleurotus eryngii]